MTTNQNVSSKKKKKEKDDLATQETLNPLYYFNDEGSTPLITAFSNSFGTAGFQKHYFEIISNVQELQD